MNEDNQMNVNRPHNYVPRKQTGSKYSDNQNYSPSVSYNYAPNSQQNRGQNQNYQQPMNRRYRNNQTVNCYDRIIKQNDIIIKLLKDIRDRLPEPPIVLVDDKLRVQKQENDDVLPPDAAVPSDPSEMEIADQDGIDEEIAEPAILEPEQIVPESSPKRLSE
jgi:hypothetical protein